MNANAMISAAPSSVALGVPGTAAVLTKPNAGNGFAAALVQAIGGTADAGASGSGTTLSATLLDMIGLQAASAAEQEAAPNVIQLLGDLLDKLNALDPNQELPTDAQNELAGVLVMLQNLLTPIGAVAPTADNPGTAAGTSAAETAAPAAQSSLPANKLPAITLSIVPAVQQTLAQLTRLLGDKLPLPAEASSLAAQLEQTINAISPHLPVPYLQVPHLPVPQIPAVQGTDPNIPAVQGTFPNIPAVQGADPQIPAVQGTYPNNPPQAQQEAVKLAASETTVLSADPEQTAALAAADIRRPFSPFRNPVWQVQTAGSNEANAVDGTALPTAVEPSEASGQNGSASAWTFLQGDTPITAPAVGTQVPASAPVPVQQFAEQIGKYLIKQFVLTQGNGMHEAKIQLHPEHLGQVDIKISIHNGQLTAQFVTENGAARDLLENQISQLRTALQGQGLQVERMEVMLQSSSSASGSFFQQNQRQPGSGQGGSGSGLPTRGGYDEADGFEAELNRTSYLREVGYGSSLNVKA